MSGRTVGRYELLEVIGRGGMSEVHLAKQPRLDRLVAIKELVSFEPAGAVDARRFLEEARIASTLSSHPNVVTVYDYFEQDGVPYISMEYLPRGSLREIVPRLTPAHVFGVLQAVLAGLQAAEKLRIIHRDLKPENFMVTDDGSVRIADFGIAKATRKVATVSLHTAPGTTIGTPHYMAPEQAMGKDVTTATDLYSLGVVAYELLVGRWPFDDVEPVVILTRHVNDPPPAPRSVKRDLDPELADWICGLLKKDPSARPPSAKAAADRLDDIAIRLLGPTWRREAALPYRPDDAVSPPALRSGPYVTVPPPTPEPDIRRVLEGDAPVPPGGDVVNTTEGPDVGPTSGPGSTQPPSVVKIIPPPVRKPWLRWAIVLIPIAALVAGGVALVRQPPEAPPPDVPRRVDLARLSPGPAYSIDPPPGWQCAKAACKEQSDQQALRLDLTNGPARFSILRYRLTRAQREEGPRRLLAKEVTRILHSAPVLGPDVSIDARDGTLGDWATWRYVARSESTAAAGIVIVTERDGYWLAAQGPSDRTVEADVDGFRSTLETISR